jgi:ATP-dependent DNA helicase RecG
LELILKTEKEKEQKEEYKINILDKYKLTVKALTEEEVKILKYCYNPKKKKEILEICLKISNQTKNFKHHTDNLLQLNLITQTLPNLPTSKLQKYVITNEGKICLHQLT